MAVDVLREYVTLILLEKIRSKKGQKGIMGDHFDMKKFESLFDYHVMIGYANKFLEKLGQGSSRVAFLVSNRYVLKIAMNEKGLAQNEAEIAVYTNPKSRPVVAKVYRSDDEYKWVLSELVKPLQSTSEFKALSGIQWATFVNIMNDSVKDKKPLENKSPFLSAIVHTALENSLMPGDLESVDHYGKTADGRVVLLDYGFTGEVWKKHYKTSKSSSVRDSDAPLKPASDDTEVDTSADLTAKTKVASPKKQSLASTAQPPGRRKAVGD